jgi:hypothetical protein
MPCSRTGGVGCRAAHSQYPQSLEIGSQFHASAALPPGRKEGSYQLNRRLFCPRAELGVLERTSCPLLGSKSESSSRQPHRCVNYAVQAYRKL